MSKKKHATAELIEARVAREQEWAYYQRVVAGLPYPSIRALANRDPDEGGLGYDLSSGALVSLVAQYRAAQGEIVGTREERIERRQLEIDAVAREARASIQRAAEVGELDVHASKLLLDARAAEAKMHGDDAATKIEAEVVTRDGVMQDLNAALVAMGETPIEVDA